MSDGVEKEMTPASEAKPDRAKTETRDAVEAAIDMTKEDRNTTWEQRARQSRRITRWNQPTNAGKGNHGKRKS
jgi:hypothetical protein